MLIVFDGLQRTGKSTVIKILKDYLNELGLEVVTTEWNSVPEIEQLTYKRKINGGFTPFTWFALHFADLALRYEEVIVPALKEKKVVLCDRYVHTGLTRDQLKGVPKEYLEDAYSYFKPPDWSFFFTIDPAIVYLRHKEKLGKSLMHKYNSGLDIFNDDSSDYLKYIKYQQKLIVLYECIHIETANSSLLDTTNMSLLQISEFVKAKLAILLE